MSGNNTPNSLSLSFTKTPNMTIVNKPLPPLPPPSRSNSKDGLAEDFNSSMRDLSILSNSTHSNNNSTSSLHNVPSRNSSSSSRQQNSNNSSEQLKNEGIYSNNSTNNSSHKLDSRENSIKSDSTESNMTLKESISRRILSRQSTLKGDSQKQHQIDQEQSHDQEQNKKEDAEAHPGADYTPRQTHLELNNIDKQLEPEGNHYASLNHIGTNAWGNKPSADGLSVPDLKIVTNNKTASSSSLSPINNQKFYNHRDFEDVSSTGSTSRPTTPVSGNFRKLAKQLQGPLRKAPPIPKNMPIPLKNNIQNGMSVGAGGGLEANTEGGAKKSPFPLTMPKKPVPQQAGSPQSQQKLTGMNEKPKPKMKLGLSARRGMKLDFALNPVLSMKMNRNTNSPALTSSNTNYLDSDNASNISCANFSRGSNTTATSTVISNGSTSSSSSSDGGSSGLHAPNFTGSLISSTFNSHSTNSRNSLHLNNTRSLNMGTPNNSILNNPAMGNMQHNANSLGGGSNVNSMGGGSNVNSMGSINNKSMGLFANFSKYVNIKSGSLNFAGKLSLSSKGVDFSNGSSFRITLDELEYIGELGRGNYGNVSKVLHKPTNIIMAMKEVRLELDESKFRQILMELDILHRCNSPYIVDFYGAFFIEGAVYMCMECMDGGSLDKLYQAIPNSEGIDEPRLAYIAISVINGLKTLKDEHNIIHRDVKPTNILCSAMQGTVKLCDFGVSGNLVASLAKTNIGCQSYMAPERIKSFNPDAATYTVQSDIWSLGLSLLEMALGKYPYPPETFDNIFSQLSAIVDGQPPRLPVGKFSPEAQDFISRCLDKQPDRRPSYAMLLEHPWLKKYENVDVGMKDYLTDRMQKINEYQEANNVDVNDEVQTRPLPALHKGGL
ncbi:hypothetical protein ACO0QE_001326 [Hanseniaspora vineae]